MYGDDRDVQGSGGDDPHGPGTAQPATADLRNQIIQWYQQYMGRTPSSDEVTTWATQWGNNPSQLEQYLKNSDEAKAYAQKQTAPPPSAPPPGGGGGGGAPGGSLYGPFGPFTEPFTAPNWAPIPGAPQWKDIPSFTAPTMAQAEQDPGYQFGKQQGEQALTQDKAQQGLLYGGGTLKDILAWGSNYATQRYNDVYWRARDQYMTNTQNQYILPYQQQMAQWQTMVPATQRQNEFQYNAAYQKWLQDYNMWNNNRKYALDSATALG